MRYDTFPITLDDFPAAYTEQDVLDEADMNGYSDDQRAQRLAEFYLWNQYRVMMLA